MVCYDCQTPLSSPHRICGACWHARAGKFNEPCVYCGEPLNGERLWHASQGKYCKKELGTIVFEYAVSEPSAPTTDVADW